MRDLRPLFAPRSVAIVGASSRPESISGRPLANLQGQQYQGALYPVNPNRQEISGLRCYRSVADLPEAPDLALIVLPTAGVMPAVEACARRGVRAAIIISAGFAEATPEGASQQARMTAMAREAGMVVCGPNSIGLLNIVDRIPLTFTPAGDMRRWREGRIALVAQSGGIMTSLANRAVDAGIGLRYAVATGNEADLTAVDALEYLAEDPSIRALAALVETTGDGARFMQLCDRLLELGKPLVLFKIARTEPGGVVARSHTGALAGSYAALRAVMKHGGVIEVQDIDDLVEYAAACAGGRLPAGDRVAIVTESGGAGAIAVDRAQDFGLTIPAFRPETAERLQKFLPSFASESVQNPFDVTAQIMENPPIIGDIGTTLLDDTVVDSLLIISPGNGEPGRISGEVRLQRLSDSPKPVFHVILSSAPAADMRNLLRRAGAPVLDSPGKAVDVIAGLWQFSRARERHLATMAESSLVARGEDVRRALAGLGGAPTEFQTKQLLARFGLPIVREQLARSPEEAEAAAGEMGYPVALKVNSADIVHKTEAGGVALGIKDATELREGYAALLSRVARSRPEAAVDGVLVSQMVPAALELIAGVHVDPVFGPLVLLGLGGIWAEALGDVAMRPAPVSRDDVADMVNELRGRRLLQGARGFPAARQEQLERLLLTLSSIAVGGSGVVAGIDINPVAVTQEGDLIILDASLFLVSLSHGSGSRQT